MTVKFNTVPDGTYFRIISEGTGHSKDTIFVRKSFIPNIVRAFAQLTAIRKSDNKAWVLNPELDVEIIQS
jgi:hypothetical protein